MEASDLREPQGISILVQETFGIEQVTVLGDAQGVLHCTPLSASESLW